MCILHTNISQPSRDFVIISNLLTRLRHYVPKTITLINLEQLQRFTINN